jgi:hypothetical protein
VQPLQIALQEQLGDLSPTGVLPDAFDLNQWQTMQGSMASAEVKRVFHEYVLPIIQVAAGKWPSVGASASTALVARPNRDVARRDRWVKDVDPEDLSNFIAAIHSPWRNDFVSFKHVTVMPPTIYNPEAFGSGVTYDEAFRVQDDLLRKYPPSQLAAIEDAVFELAQHLREFAAPRGTGITGHPIGMGLLTTAQWIGMCHRCSVTAIA